MQILSAPQGIGESRNGWVFHMGCMFLCLSALMGAHHVGHAASGEKDMSPVAPVDSSALNVNLMLQQCDLDSIQRMSGAIFRARDPKPFLRDVAVAWRRLNTLPAEAAPCLRRTQVQIYLADVLAQGVANGFDLDVDSASLANLLRAHTANADTELAFVAITGLSYIAGSFDLKNFAELIRSSTGARRLAAIEALALHCSPEAVALLRDIADPNVRSEAARFSAVREVRCANRKL